MVDAYCSTYSLTLLTWPTAPPLRQTSYKRLWTAGSVWLAIANILSTSMSGPTFSANRHLIDNAGWSVPDETLFRRDRDVTISSTRNEDCMSSIESNGPRFPHYVCVRQLLGFHLPTDGRGGSVVGTSVVPTFPCRLYDHFLGKLSAMGQPTRPTQPAIPPGLVNEQ